MFDKLKKMFSKKIPEPVKPVQQSIIYPKSKEQQKEEIKQIALLVEKHTGKVCKKCSGRGYESWNTIYGTYILCDCIINRGEEIRKDKIKNNELSFGQTN
jgi:hypothetical protein